MATPEEVFTRTFHNMANRFSVVSSLRHVAEIGLPGAIPGIYEEWLGFAHKLFNDPEYGRFFLDKEGAIKSAGGVAGMGKMMAENQLKTFKAAVEAASLVFAHSILDSAAMEFLRITTLHKPSDWAEGVDQKQIPISVMKDKSYDDVLKEKVSQYVETFDRQSLLVKVEKLFQICKPEKDFAPMDDYGYDKARLEKLDTLRHEVVHGAGPVTDVSVTDNDIWFLQKTAFYLMAMVNMRYGTRIDTTKFAAQTGIAPKNA